MAAPLPTIQVQAQFTPGTWTDISGTAANPLVKSFDITRPVTRLQGPLWQYQAGTASIVLDNSDGRFDPDNLAGPYTSSTGLQQVVWVLGPERTSTWTAPRNLSGTTVKVECLGPASAGTLGAGGGGGEYASEPVYPVIPGNTYAVLTPSGNSGGQTTFDTTGVVANGATPNSSTPGTGSTNSVHFDGGAGGIEGTTGVGGGGGSSGGSASAGNAGAAGDSGGAGGIAPAGGYGGGEGAPDGRYAGGSGLGPGGAGGGQGATITGNRTKVSPNGHSAGGQVRLTYFVTVTSSTVVTQVLPMVPVEVTASWNVAAPTTVSVTASGTNALNGLGLTVKVLTGAAAIQNGATASSTTANPPELAITPNATGSWIYGALQNNLANTAYTPAATTTFSQNTPDAINFTTHGTFRSTATTTGGTPVTVGATAPVANASRIALAEILVAAGHSLAEDASSPAAVSVTSAVTVATASFTPPAGSLLVAMVATDHTIGSVALALTNTGPPLTWTQLVSDANNLASVWIAQAPGTYSLFSGFADSWTETAVDYEGGYSEITLGATDGFGVLTANTLVSLAAPVGAADDSGTRANRILDWAGWPPSARKIDTGDTLQQATSLGSDALSLLQLTADTEIGEAYVNGAGSIVFRHRQAILSDARSVTPQAVFGDLPGTVAAAGTELPYASVSRANDNATLANDVQITAAGSSNLQEATDFTAVFSDQGARSYARTDLLLPDDPTAFLYANWVLFISKNSADRFDTMTVDPLADTANLYPQVLGREIGDRIQTWKRPLPFFTPGNATVTSPGSTTAIVNLAVAAGTYTVQWTVTLAGTVAAADANNFALYNGSTLVATSVNPGASGSYPQRPVGMTVSAGVPDIKILSVAAGTTGAVYGAFLSSGITKDVFIRGIEHAFDAGAQTWLTTWTLQSASSYGAFMTLDSPSSGLLDTDALAY